MAGQGVLKAFFIHWYISYDISKSKSVQDMTCALRGGYQYMFSFVKFANDMTALTELENNDVAPCPPIDSIMALMTVWRITGKIIWTAIIITYAQL